MPGAELVGHLREEQIRRRAPSMPNKRRRCTMSTPTPTVPIARHAGEGEALWFLGSLVTIKASGEDTGGRMAVVEHLSPRGSGSPLHVHRNEDESFYVLEGELTMWVDGETILAREGSFVYGPRDVPHTYLVSSGEARFLV